MLFFYLTAKENFGNAYRVMFVATSEPRQLIISEHEESQLGNLYLRALSLKGTEILFLLFTQCEIMFFLFEMVYLTE